MPAICQRPPGVSGPFRIIGFDNPLNAVPKQPAHRLPGASARLSNIHLRPTLHDQVDHDALLLRHAAVFNQPVEIHVGAEDRLGDIRCAAALQQTVAAQFHGVGAVHADAIPLQFLHYARLAHRYIIPFV